MTIQIIQVPYDSGHESVRTGRGPAHFIRHGLDKTLHGSGHRVHTTTVRSSIPFSTEIGTSFDVIRILAQHVKSAVDHDHFPVVLAGNCNSCVGTLAGLGAKRLGIIWFDAHGDFNTPETTLTGFLDGMGLAMATGRCWRQLLTTVPNFDPVPDKRVVHVGSRDLDQTEREMFIEAKIPLLEATAAGRTGILTGLNDTLSKLKNHVDGVYLHIDMDVMETELGQPNHLAVPGGLKPGDVRLAIKSIKRHVNIMGCAIASYDPALDESNSVLDAGISLVDAIVEASD